MQVGTLVKMKGDPHGVIGVISEAITVMPWNEICYKVLWADEICDTVYADERDLEVLCK